MSIMIDIISRKTSVKQTVIEQGNTSLVVYEPSVIQVHAPVSGVEHYARQGSDLLIYMKDGSVIRVNGYFQQDPETKENSELVFEEGPTLNHVTFANADTAVGMTPTVLTPQTVTVSTIEPFLDTAGSASAYPWGWIVGGTLLGGGIGALLAGRDDGDNDTTVITNPTRRETPAPSFIVTDNQGGRQGLLTTGNITDDNTPTFSGSGQARATIEIKDSNGTVIATTTVGNNGLWTVSLPPQSDGQHSWSVSQTDDGETILSGTINLNIDTASATITPATTAGDNIVNAVEQGAGFTLSGTSAHLPQGSDITLTLNGKTYTTEVGADGIWQVSVPVADAKALAEGLQTVTITGVDAAGNTVTATQNLTVDTQAPALQINAIAQDNIINAVEHNASLVVSGRTDAGVGQRVTVTLNGATHTATVGTDGTWQITLAANEVKALAEGNHTLSASVSDKAGNNAQTSASLTVDTVAPAITINTIAGDDVLNLSEQTVAQIISGGVSGAAAGDVVTLTLGSHDLKGVVLDDGTWNIGVTPEIISSLGLGAHTITVNVTDAAGNTSSATRQVSLSGVAPSVSIDPVSQDNVLNAQEAQQPLTLSGQSNLPDGSTVTVTLNNVTYTASVSGQAWSLKVPVTDVINLANTTYVVTANATDITGNTGTAKANLLVDTVSPQVIINTFAGDNQVNSAEAASDQTLSGRVVGAAQGDSVSVVIDGYHYTATVGSNLTWSINVPASDLRAMGDGPIAIEASVTNSHGNTGTGTLAIVINATLPGLGINVISGDDVVNAIEQQYDLTITGTSSHLVAGTIITLSINNIDYQAVTDSNGHWQVGVPAADLQNWTAGTVVVNASAVDSAGNPVSVNHDVLLDLSQVAITINTVSGDDLINAAEKGGPLTLTGETQAVEPGQTVVVKLAGQTFTTQVQADGTWSLLIPASTMAGLPEGQLEISATVTNASGNTGTTIHPVTIDAQPAIISINPLTSDNIINAAEVQQPLQLTGQTNAEPGQTVTVTLNNKTYQTTVGDDGSWSVTVPAADMGMLRDGNATVTATVNDVAGNVSSASRVALVDVTQPVITISPVAGDDILNAAEHGQALLISGTTTGAETGDLVTLTLNGVDYTTIVNGSGNWSLGLPASVVSGLADQTYTLNVSVTDRSGNTGSSTHDFAVITTEPVVGINTIASDDVINATEKGQDLVLSGTSGQPAGTAVTVTLNGQNYTATTDASGNWSVTVPASAVSALGEASYAITAQVTDSQGNSGSASHTVRVDSALPGVTVNPVATDDIINAAEAGADQTVSGRVTGAASGDTVTVSLGGETYTTTVQADLSWSISVPSADLQALGDGALTVSASVTNAQGNTGTGTRDISIDASLPGLRVDTVAGDDVVNSIEHGQALVITGSSAGLTAGAALSVAVSGKTYAATVLADGTWSAGIPAADVSAWPAGPVAVTVSGNSSAGNPVTVSHDVTVDLAPVAVSIDAVTADEVVNAAEKGTDLALSGSTANVEAGRTVSVTFGGKTYTAAVQADGSWSTTVPATDMATLPDGAATVQASVTNVAGNTASTAHAYSVDATAPAVSINVVATDNVINSSEATNGVTVSGTSTAEAGQSLTVTLGSNSWQTTVGADGTWSLTLPASVLASLVDNSYSLQASVTDKAGNPGSTARTIILDTTAPTLSFNAVAVDDVINSTEHTQAQIVSGTATGAAAGDRLVLTVDGQQYVTTTDAAGNWSVGIPASVISGLQDGTITLSATITDSAGNSSSLTHDIQVNTSAVSLTVSTIATDNLINAAEAGNALTLSGTGTNLAAGTIVTVLLNGKGYTATMLNNGTWSTTIPQADIAALADATSYTVAVSAQDNVGNNASASRVISVDLTPPTIDVNTISADNVLNAMEQQQPLTINGSTSAGAGQTVTVTLGGETYTTTVAPNGTWAVNVPTADLASLSQGAQTVTAMVNDLAGNPGQATHTLTVDTVSPGITIDTVAGDDIISTPEQQAGQTISGTTDAEAGQIVTLTFNGQSWTTTVSSGGTWSVQIPGQQFSGLRDGSYTLTATVADKAGNTGSTSHEVTLNGSTPTIVINTVASDDILNAAEHSSPLVISGTSTAPAGQTVTLVLNGKTYTTVVQNDGSWNTTLGSADVALLADGGAYVINAQVSNAIGNTGNSNHTLIVDLSAPAMGINILSLQSDTGISTTDFITSSKPVVLNGSLTAAPGGNEKAQISLDGGATWSDLSVNGTSWQYNDSRTLADGSYVYQVRVIDTAGNVGATASQTVVLDTVAPEAAKTITLEAINTDTGLSSTDFITSDTTLALSGRLGAAPSAGEFAQISVDGGTTWQNVQVSGLTWTWTDGRTLADGNYNYMLRMVDASGNVGATASQVVTVDTTAPAGSKTISITGISDDTGLSNSDFVTQDTSLTVRGTLGASLAADERAQISLDGGVTWQTLTVVGTGWSFADGRTLTDGAWTYTVRVVDLAGNVGEVASQTVVVDATAPEAAKTITVTGISDDTGVSNSDFITSDTSLTLRGALGTAPGTNEFAQISTDNGATWNNVNVDATGLNWTWTDGRTLTDGTLTYLVRVVDLAGNVGVTGSQTVLIDTVRPTQLLTIDAISTDSGSSASDFITNDTSLTVSGTLGAGLASGESAQISLDNGSTWVTLTTSGTQWSYTDTRTLGDGNYVYQIRVIDAAGNTGTVVSRTVTIDTLNPVSTPSIVSYTDDVGERKGIFSNRSSTDDTTPLLSGVLSGPLASGEVVYMYRNGILLGAVTMVSALNWTYADSGLVDGSYTYSARVVDLAGNVTSSADYLLTVDTSVPTTLALVTNQSTRDTTPILSGTLNAALANGQYVEVTVNGKTYTSQEGGAVVVDPANNTWYVQIPATDAISVSSSAYTVTAQVKSSAGNGNNANISNGQLNVNAGIDYTPTWTTANESAAHGLTYGLDGQGNWTVLANQTIMQSTDPLTWSKTALTLVNTSNNYTTSSMADFDRNGTADLFISRDDYGSSYINGFRNNGDGTFSAAYQVSTGTSTWYGSIVAFDREGDGWLDFWVSDAGGPDSNTFLYNNAGTLVGTSTTNNTGGSATVGGVVGGYYSLTEGSGVDLNNDGKIDLAQHTYNLNNNYTLSTLVNQGNGTFVWGQNTTNVFNGGAGSSAAGLAVSMTWADFNADGYMDLYLPATNGKTGYGSLYLNNGRGVLGSPIAVGATGTTYTGQYSLAVDWNGDGMMDIVRVAQTGQSYLYTNMSNSSSWSQSAIGSAMAGVTSGVAAMDYDWDGAVDVLITKQTGSTFLIRNTNSVADSTAIHLRIVDGNGINAYYGNTVQLYNSSGVLVASQILNPQSGIGVNDTSALVSFYGLSASESYHAVLVNTVNNVSSNITETINASWGDLTASSATHAYNLSAEAGNASTNGNFVGTGYNDTFFATAGTDTYNGAGGWTYTSDTGIWSATGGTDVVDFRLSTVGITADLSRTTAQNTGFNTATFTNIEGITGSDFNDTITGSSGNNLLEGRGGDDTFNIANGGHDTLMYKLLNAIDATGGNGSDVINGFTVGTWEGPANSDRIDIRELLHGSGYTGNGKASYVNGAATLDPQAGNITDFVKVNTSGSDTVIQVDRDGDGGTFAPTTMITLSGVHTDLATLLANHQLMVV